MGASYFFLHQFPQAKKHFQKALEENPTSQEKKFLQKSILLTQKAQEKSPKSPFLALLFSLFPGGGYLYLGEWDNALFSVLLIGFTGFLAYDGYIRESTVQLAIFGSLSTGLYIGSIYSSYRESKKHNLLLYKEEEKELKKELIKLELAIGTSFY